MHAFQSLAFSQFACQQAQHEHIYFEQIRLGLYFRYEYIDVCMYGYVLTKPLYMGASLVTNEKRYYPPLLSGDLLRA